MDSIGLTEPEKNKIWILLKAILELGNLKYDDKKQQIDEEKPCDIVNK